MVKLRTSRWSEWLNTEILLKSILVICESVETIFSSFIETRFEYLAAVIESIIAAATSTIVINICFLPIKSIFDIARRHTS